MGLHILSSRLTYPSRHALQPPPHLAAGRAHHTWQCLGAWLGRQSPRLDDVHFELTIPLLQANLHIPCKRPQQMRLGSGFKVQSRTQTFLSA